MVDLAVRVREVYNHLHQIPEISLTEFKTAAYLAEQLLQAGYQVKTGLAGTGVSSQAGTGLTGVLAGQADGPTVAVRADMDALLYIVNGTETAIHSCGHDAHCAMVLTVAEEMARRGIERGSLKIIFQPAEEKLSGARQMIEDGVIDDVDILIGIHLRPAEEAGLGEAIPALHHGASAIVEVTLAGEAAHGARPHLGVNVIDAAAAVVNAVNAIHVNPTVPSSAKVTKLQAGGTALNTIPDKAEMALDLRAQHNSVMKEMLDKVKAAVQAAAATVGAGSAITAINQVPAAEYDENLIKLAQEAIEKVLGPAGLLPPVYTPGGEDFHFFAQAKPALRTVYIGLGVDLTPGLHHPEMNFNVNGLINGVNILLYMVNRLLRGG